jgi:hypothetical protein
MTRLTITSVSDLAWSKGFVFCPSVRRGSRYRALPASWAIFAKDPGPWAFFDLQDANRFFARVEAPIATRVDYDLIRWRKTRRAVA